MYIFLTWIYISLIIARICLKTSMCIAEMCMEGSMSQNFDLGLSFILSRRRNFEGKKITKVTHFFIIKYELGPKQKKLRHSSLDKNVLYIY